VLSLCKRHPCIQSLDLSGAMGSFTHDENFLRRLLPTLAK